VKLCFDAGAGKKQNMPRQKRQKDDKPSGHKKGKQKNREKKSGGFSFHQQKRREEKQHRDDISDNLHQIRFADDQVAGTGQGRRAGHAGAEPQQA